MLAKELIQYSLTSLSIQCFSESPMELVGGTEIGIHKQRRSPGWRLKSGNHQLILIYEDGWKLSKWVTIGSKEGRCKNTLWVTPTFKSSEHQETWAKATGKNDQHREVCWAESKVKRVKTQWSTVSSSADRSSTEGWELTFGISSSLECLTTAVLVTGRLEA